MTINEALSSMRHLYKSLMRVGYSIHDINQLTMDDLDMLSTVDFSEEEEEVIEISPSTFFANGGFR